jgi:hypothetical protein
LYKAAVSLGFMVPYRWHLADLKSPELAGGSDYSGCSHHRHRCGGSSGTCFADLSCR